MENSLWDDFFDRHGLSAGRLDVLREAERMAEAMRRGLDAQDEGLPMLPAWLRVDGSVPAGACAAVIDAGGTNLRTGLVRFEENGPVLYDLKKMKMPGVERPVSWEALIAFIADAVESLMDRADRIGFCFSYSAEITPERDGRVIAIDKELTVEGSAGQMVGRSLTEELARRGFCGKRCVVLNDTTAVLLAGAALGEHAGGLVGQVSGTGTNTCCVLPLRAIGKLGIDSDERIVVNLESGSYDGLPRGDLDRALDRASKNPGKKWMEKLTAGVYLGQLARLAVRAAAAEGLVGASCAESVAALKGLDAGTLDAWAAGEGLDALGLRAKEAAFLQKLAMQLFERSARAMCANLLGILLLTGAGKDEAHPALICAEGSLVKKGRCYRAALERDFAAGCAALGRFARWSVSEETTLPGAAMAALLG